MTEGRLWWVGGGEDGDYCNRNTIVLRLRCVVALPSATAASILLTLYGSTLELLLSLVLSVQ